MARKREEGGRFRSDSGVSSEIVAVKVRKAPRPRYCKSFARARMAEALPEIVEKLVEEAKKGSVPHMNLLLKTAGLDARDAVPKVKDRRGKSLEALLMEGWRTAASEPEASLGG